jgi:hypothetical protein
VAAGRPHVQKVISNMTIFTMFFSEEDNPSGDRPTTGFPVAAPADDRALAQLNISF